MNGLKPYKETGRFRFWCQKVLPQVYDDSLSYYEVLNKVVVYLNDVIENLDTVEDNLDTVNDTVSNISDTVSTQGGDITTLKEDVLGLKEDARTLYASVLSLNRTVYGGDNPENGLDFKVDALERQVTNISTRLEGLITYIGELTSMCTFAPLKYGSPDGETLATVYLYNTGSDEPTTELSTYFKYGYFYFSEVFDNSDGDHYSQIFMPICNDNSYPSNRRALSEINDIHFRPTAYIIIDTDTAFTGYIAFTDTYSLDGDDGGVGMSINCIAGPNVFEFKPAIEYGQIGNKYANYVCLWFNELGEYTIKMTICYNYPTSTYTSVAQITTKAIAEIAKKVPVPPVIDGTYKLRCTVSSGIPTYSWVSDV